MKTEIRVAGFGGQGVITFGYVLAQAASIYDEKYSLMTQSYGPEARGGACHSDVIISDVSIDYPKLSNLNYFVAMSVDAYNQFYKSMKRGAVVILEQDLVHIPEDKWIEGVIYYKIPSIRTAEELGNQLVANMVMLGAVQAITGAVSEISLVEAIKQRFPRYIELNVKALRRGIELGKEVKGEG